MKGDIESRLVSNVRQEYEDAMERMREENCDLQKRLNEAYADDVDTDAILSACRSVLAELPQVLHEAVTFDMGWKIIDRVQHTLNPAYDIWERHSRIRCAKRAENALRNGNDGGND